MPSASRSRPAPFSCPPVGASHPPLRGSERSMDDDDVRRPDQTGPSDKTEQQIFDEQIARASGKTVVMFGGLGILAALVMSAIALVNSTGGNHTTTVTVPAAT